MIVQNRVEFEGVVIRYFFKRSDAINRANTLTKATEEQHRDFRVNIGEYLVKNAVTGELYDLDGKLPEEIITKLDPPKRKKYLTKKI